MLEIKLEKKSGYFVAVIGGAVSGSEAAYRLAERGIYVAVFDQNALPYGKLEDGLPKWHNKLRDQEIRKIDDKLQHPGIHFIPNIKVGYDIPFKELVANWGFNAVLLAAGAWRDRPLPVPDIDYYIGRGFYYQNPLMYWFNHKHEPGFTGPGIHVKDNAAVIGGGLASLDVAKLIMLELVQGKLAETGHAIDLFTLEQEGIAAILAQKDLSLKKLGITGCTLYYRRRLQDMPLAEIPAEGSAAKQEKIYALRLKILANFQSKYLFNVEELSTPIDKIVKDNRLAGLVMQKSTMVNGKVQTRKTHLFEVLSPMVVSSIGSIPTVIPGLPMKGDIYAIEDLETGKIKGYDHLFALGNAVTGRGNIRASLKHGRQVSETLANSRFAWQEEDYQEIFNLYTADATARSERLLQFIQKKQLLAPETFAAITEKLKNLQKKNGYDGDYSRWIKQHLPIRLEAALPSQH
jgi:ferredoxin--NADP+ reductase